MEEQIDNFLAYSDPEVGKNIVLVGNKTDLHEQRVVSSDEAVQLGKRLGLSAVFETSAKEGGDQIEEAFIRAIVNCVDIQNNQENILEVRWQARSRVFSDQQSYKRQMSY